MSKVIEVPGAIGCDHHWGKAQLSRQVSSEIPLYVSTCVREGCGARRGVEPMPEDFALFKATIKEWKGKVFTAAVYGPITLQSMADQLIEALGMAVLEKAGAERSAQHFADEVIQLARCSFGVPLTQDQWAELNRLTPEADEVYSVSVGFEHPRIKLLQDAGCQDFEWNGHFGRNFFFFACYADDIVKAKVAVTEFLAHLAAPPAEDEAPPTEPEDGDYTTKDHRQFYQYGKLVLTAPKDAEWSVVTVLLTEHMEAQKFFPNVWFISDHGNPHLIDMTDDSGPK